MCAGHCADLINAMLPALNWKQNQCFRPRKRKGFHNFGGPGKALRRFRGKKCDYILFIMAMFLIRIGRLNLLELSDERRLSDRRRVRSIGTHGTFLGALTGIDRTRVYEFVSVRYSYVQHMQYIFSIILKAFHRDGHKFGVFADYLIKSNIFNLISLNQSYRHYAPK